MEEQQFNNLVEQLKALATKMSTKRANFKKEPKRRLKDAIWLKDWLDSIQEIWTEIEEKNDIILEHQEQLKETTYYKKKRYAKAKLEYMAANIRFRLSAFDQEDELSENEEQINDSIQNYVTPIVRTIRHRVTVLNSTDESEEEVNENRQSHYPNYVMNNPKMREKADEIVERFNNKTKLFAREIDIIESYVKNGLKTRAKLALSDIEKARNDLSDCLEEVSFILGENISEYEALYDTLIFRYRQLKEELSYQKRSNVEPVSLKLKPIEIPLFKGTFKSWPTFSGLFKTMIINNNSLNEIQKMQF